MVSTRFLYLHGFASGPKSTKGRAVAARFAQLGRDVTRLDLRVPSFEHLRTSAMSDVGRSAIGGDADRAVVMGSSLGAYTAARAAALDARIVKLVLLAPAFGLLARWRERLGEGGWAAWRERGWLAVEDYSTHRPGRVDFGFVEDLEALEAKLGATPEVHVPTLVIHGRADEVVPIEGSRRWAEARPHVRLVEVDDGHELVAALPVILRETEAFVLG